MSYHHCNKPTSALFASKYSCIQSLLPQVSGKLGSHNPNRQIAPHPRFMSESLLAILMLPIANGAVFVFALMPTRVQLIYSKLYNQVIL